MLIAFWLALFLVFIAPFDASDLSFSIRLRILPFYGVIYFLGYAILIPPQNWIFKKMGKWTVFSEVLFIVFLNILSLIGCYLYYTTDIINGTYSFSKFTLEVYYPTLLIILPILILSRWYLGKKATQVNSDKVILTGSNKLDVLQILLADLVCIASADNYVEVSYLIHKELHKKLLRITLKNIHPQVPGLLKVHRSYLINPSHFKEWKDSSTIFLTQLEVPVSKNYKKDVLKLHDHSSLKANNSPQT